MRPKEFPKTLFWLSTSAQRGEIFVVTINRKQKNKKETLVQHFLPPASCVSLFTLTLTLLITDVDYVF